jgi:hypothetical protein
MHGSMNVQIPFPTLFRVVLVVAFVAATSPLLFYNNKINNSDNNNNNYKTSYPWKRKAGVTNSARNS